MMGQEVTCPTTLLFPNLSKARKDELRDPPPAFSLTIEHGSCDDKKNLKRAQQSAEQLCTYKRSVRRKSHEAIRRHFPKKKTPKLIKPFRLLLWYSAIREWIPSFENPNKEISKIFRRRLRRTFTCGQSEVLKTLSSLFNLRDWLQIQRDGEKRDMRKNHRERVDKGAEEKKEI